MISFRYFFFFSSRTVFVGVYAIRVRFGYFFVVKLVEYCECLRGSEEFIYLWYIPFFFNGFPSLGWGAMLILHRLDAYRGKNLKIERSF